jgi:hypothetical protein
VAAISPNVSSDPQLGTGSKTDFAFNFSVVTATDVGVYVDGIRKTYGADYIVTFGDVSGTVTFTAALASGATILLVSEPDYLQASEFADQGAYNLSTVNAINRRGAIRDLVTKDRADRSLKVPRGEDGLTIPAAEDRAEALLGFDEDGDPIAIPATASDLGTIAAMANDLETIADNLAAILAAPDFADDAEASAAAAAAAALSAAFFDPALMTIPAQSGRSA